MVENLRLHSASSNLTGTAEQIDTAIVFGAGASLPALPSQQGLVDRLHGARPHPRIALAQRYLRRVFPGLPNPTIRFEDVVGPLEIAEAEEYWFHFAGTSSDHRRRLVTNKAVLDSLDTWLAMSLDPETIPNLQVRDEPQQLTLPRLVSERTTPRQQMAPYLIQD